MRRALSTTALLLLTATAAQAAPVTLDFEEFNLAPGTAVNDFTANDPDGFASGGAFFNNSYEESVFNGQTYVTWSGWAVSAVRDVTTPGFDPNTFALLNQFGAYNLAAPVGSGAGGSNHYLVAAGSGPNASIINLPDGASLISADFTNTTYAALSMLNGDSFAKKFGGPSGNDPDFFRLTITGYSGLDATGATVGSPIEFFLADYTGAVDDLVSQWTTVSLAGLSGARSLGFALDSSDNSDFGGGVTFMNTPASFALDNLTFDLAAVPEPSSMALVGFGAVALLGAARRRRRG